MMTRKTIQLRQHGLTPIDVEPVFEDDKIILFDFYIDERWQGSRRLLRYIEEEYGYKHR